MSLDDVNVVGRHCGCFFEIASLEIGRDEEKEAEALDSRLRDRLRGNGNMTLNFETS